MVQIHVLLDQNQYRKYHWERLISSEIVNENPLDPRHLSPFRERCSSRYISQVNSSNIVLTISRNFGNFTSSITTNFINYTPNLYGPNVSSTLEIVSIILSSSVLIFQVNNSNLPQSNTPLSNSNSSIVLDD